jgi:5'(3')-deoxyribonucleotidase
LNVGFDLDGVLADIVGQLIHYLDFSSGITVQRAALVSEDVETCVPITKEEIATYFRDPRFFRTLKPLPGAARLLRALHSAGHAVHIVTDRFWYEGLHADTEAWLRRHQMLFDSLRFASKAMKQEVALQLDLTLFVEDQLSNANRLSSVCDVLLLDRPYNRGDTESRVQRVKTLGQVARRILGAKIR